MTPDDTDHSSIMPETLGPAETGPPQKPSSGAEDAGGPGASDTGQRRRSGSRSPVPPCLPASRANGRRSSGRCQGQRSPASPGMGTSSGWSEPPSSAPIVPCASSDGRSFVPQAARRVAGLFLTGICGRVGLDGRNSTASRVRVSDEESRGTRRAHLRAHRRAESGDWDDRRKRQGRGASLSDAVQRL
jgi:hypothetical protein